jgi:hypothetical protein
MVGVRVIKGLSPLKFVREEGLNHEDSLIVHVSERVAVSECVSQKVYEYADPVRVVAIDGEAKNLQKKRQVPNPYK